MKSEPECEPFVPSLEAVRGSQPAADQLGAGATAPPQLGLLDQKFVDDIALHAPSMRAAQAQLSMASTFLQAYGMAFHPGKCFHTPVTAAAIAAAAKD